MSLEAIRSKYPQYSDVSDGDLVYGMWENNYSDMPMGEFADKMDLSKRQFAEMVVSARKSGYKPSSKGVSTKPVNYDIGQTGLPRAVIQGASLGGSDEVVAGLASLGKKITGDDRPISDIYSQEHEAEERRLAQYRRTNPVKSAVTEFGGAMATPLGVAKTAKQALGMGTGLGAVSGFLSDSDDRLKGAAYGAVFGALLGPAIQQGGNLLQTQFGKMIKNRARKAVAEGAESIEQLKAQANDAYKVAEESGININKDQYSDFIDEVINSVSASSPVQRKALDKLMPEIAAVKEMLESSVGQQLGLSDMESLRRIAKIPAGNFNNPSQQEAAKKIINSIDELMENVTPEKVQGDLFESQANELVQQSYKTARSMWAKVRKTEAIDDIIEKAGSYAGGLESGIKNQLTSILRSNKKQASFSKPELDMMREIVEGTPMGNLIGGISQMGLSTTGGRNVFNVGSGMATGGLAGYAVGGPAGAAAGAALELAGATALKYVREKSMEDQVKILRDLISIGQVETFAQQAPKAFAVLQEAAQKTSEAAQKVGQAAIITSSEDLQRTEPRGLLAQ